MQIPYDDIEDDLPAINGGSWYRRNEGEMMLERLRWGGLLYSWFMDELKSGQMDPRYLWLFARKLVKREGDYVMITDKGLERVEKMAKEDEVLDENIKFLEKIDPDCLGWEIGS